MSKTPRQDSNIHHSCANGYETFDDKIGSLMQDIHLKAYKNLVHLYRTALTTVWDLAQFANISLILEMVHDKEMLELAVMAQKLDLSPPATQVVKETRKVPTLEMITGAMTARYPDQDLLNATVCEKIGHIFLKLIEANKAYGEAAEALAEISTKVSLQHYTLLLTAATAPTIQIIVLPNMTFPVVAPPSTSATGSNTTWMRCHS